jgi:hypothetical protein
MKERGLAPRPPWRTEEASLNHGRISVIHRFLQARQVACSERHPLTAWLQRAIPFEKRTKTERPMTLERLELSNQNVTSVPGPCVPDLSRVGCRFWQVMRLARH